MSDWVAASKISCCCPSVEEPFEVSPVELGGVKLAGLKALTSEKSAGRFSRARSAVSRSVSAVVTKRIKLETIPSGLPWIGEC